MKKLFLLTGFILCFGLTGCTEVDRSLLYDYTQEVYEQTVTLPTGLLVKEGVLTVGTSPDYAPYSFLDIELSGLSQVQGSESAIAYYVAQSLGLELEFKQIAFDGLTASLDNGSIDVIFSGLTYSESREEYYTFTDSYYNSGDGGQILLTLASNDTYSSIDDINKSSVKIAAQNASLQYELVETQLENATIQTVSTIADGITMLKNGNVDFMACSYTSALALIEVNEDVVIVDSDIFEFDVAEYGTMGLLKKDNELVTYINLALADFDNDTYAQWLIDFQEYATAISF